MLTVAAVVIAIFVCSLLFSFERSFPSASPRIVHLTKCPSRQVVSNVSEARAPQGLKALVTGAAGFIGSHVARDCVTLGMEVVALDDLSCGSRGNLPRNVRFVLGDLKDDDFVSRLFEREKFDVVYHMAAHAAEDLSHFIRNYNYQNNLGATTNLITQSVRFGTVKKFVFTSSIAVYSRDTQMTEDRSPLPENPYGVSKLACEYDLKAAHEMFGLDFVIFRPHNVYGPGQNIYNKHRNVVGTFLNQLQVGKRLNIFGDGTQTRKFSYISDVSFPIAVSGILDHVRNEVFNVGGDIAATINELSAVIVEAWGNTTARIKHSNSHKEVSHMEPDHQRLKCFFPGLPRPVGLKEGIQKMVQWVKQTGKYFKPVLFHAAEAKKRQPPLWNTSKINEVPALHDARMPLHGKSVAKAPFLRQFENRSHFWRQPKSNDGGVPSKTLLSIHTAHNAWNIATLMLVSLASVADDFDVILVDDHSDKYDQNDKAEQWGVQTLRWGKRTDGPRGVTHSWNLAWKHAIKLNYKHLIICNNDLLIPDGSISKLSRALETGNWDWISPIVSRRGSGYPNHSLPMLYGENVPNWTDFALHYSEVAREIKTLNPAEPVIRSKQLNGYAMAFNVQNMQKFQFKRSEQLLFDPKYTNVGNEDDLCQRVLKAGGHIGIHTTAYVFHFKGFTVNHAVKQGKSRDMLKGYPVIDDT